VRLDELLQSGLRGHLHAGDRRVGGEAELRRGPPLPQRERL